MDIDAELRARAFWLKDQLHGNPLGAHLQDIAAQFQDPELRRALTAERLQMLLRHATETATAYRQLRGSKELADFPIVDKQQLKDQYAAHLSHQYDPASLLTVQTGGSYGTPRVFHLTAEKRMRQRAEVIFFSRWAGFEVGMRYGLLSVNRAKPAWKRYLQNEVYLNPSRLDERWFVTARRMLQRREVRFLIGQPSVMSALAQYCSSAGAGPDAFAIEGAITLGETLTDSMRRPIRRAFGVRPLSRYAAQEAGVLAHESPHIGKYVVNAASYIVEILDLHRDEPALPGQVGRVVITDLFSHAMPLIRYDIGDLAILAPERTTEGNLPLLVSIEGRQVESVFATDGTRLFPLAISGVLRDLKQVYQYQFVQTGAASYTLKMIVQQPFTEAELIHARLLPILGRGMKLTLVAVDEIPPLPSGKRPFIRNLLGEEIHPPASLA